MKLGDMTGGGLINPFGASRRSSFFIFFTSALVFDLISFLERVPSTDWFFVAGRRFSSRRRQPTSRA